MEEQKIAAVGEVMKRKRGRPSKRSVEDKKEAQKENRGGNTRAPSPTGGEPEKRTKMDTTDAISSERPALKALDSNRTVGARLALHPSMQLLHIE